MSEKKYENLEILENFTEKDLPSLPQVTLAALELFDRDGLSNIEFKNFKRPLVVGSGNAIVTGKILFEELDAIYADENSYKLALKKNIDGVFIFSASGGKHAPIIAKAALDVGKKVQLITCTKNSQAQDVVGIKNTIVTLKNREPYTYNTSTYMGWILAKTGENPKKILDYIEKKIKPIVLDFNFKKYTGFLLVTPNELAGLNQLFIVKFIELFGRVLSRDVKSFEELKHAITVVPFSKELCIQFGGGKVDFEGDILKIPIPKNCGLGMMMAIVYFVIGQIQEQNPQYFKKNIEDYIKRNSKGSFGKVMSVIVE